MSSSFRYALRGALLAISLSACSHRGVEEHKTPLVEVRVQLDAERNRVWLLTRKGLALIDTLAPDTIRAIKLPDWQFAGQPYGCLPDLALGPKGEVVVSSDVMPALWRVDPNTLGATRHELTPDADNDKDVGFTIIRFIPAQGVYLGVSAPHGTLWRIDRGFKYAHRLMRQIPRGSDCGVRAESILRQFGMLN
jgi:hypothetical protein